MTLYGANINTEADGSNGVNIRSDTSFDDTITNLADISDVEQQERERLRKLNRERVRRYRLRHRKVANDPGRVSQPTNSRKRIASKPKPRTSTSLQEHGQQPFVLLILLSIIFLLVIGVGVRCYGPRIVAILRRKTPMGPFGDQDGRLSEF